MRNNEFENDYLEACTALKKKKVLFLFLQVISIGFFNKNRALHPYIEKVEDCKNNLIRFNNIDKKIKNINEIKTTNKLNDVRTGEIKDSSFKVSNAHEYGQDWEIIRQNILSRDTNQCQEEDGNCSGILEVHHIVPLTKGGSNESDNLITLCHFHHSLKHEHMKNKL